MKLKNEEDDERSRGRMLGYDLPVIRPNGLMGLVLAP
jgi:hypothetical protein